MSCNSEAVHSLNPHIHTLIHAQMHRLERGQHSWQLIGARICWSLDIWHAAQSYHIKRLNPLTTGPGLVHWRVTTKNIWAIRRFCISTWPKVNLCRWHFIISLFYFMSSKASRWLQFSSLINRCQRELHFLFRVWIPDVCWYCLILTQSDAQLVIDWVAASVEVSEREWWCLESYQCRRTSDQGLFIWVTLVEFLVGCAE